MATGTLPGIGFKANALDRARRLRAYALTPLKEEAQAEQIVRRLEPFGRFLEIAAGSIRPRQSTCPRSYS